MARIELAPEVRDDLERILDHLLENDPEHASSRLGEIMQAIDVLGTNPLIGRPTAGRNREIVIGRRSHGYVALYRYIAAVDVAFVLAIRGQREAGYRRG
jgi:plasmid stabilization system protein ParE